MRLIAIVLVLVAFVALPGCLTEAQQARLDELTMQVPELEGKAERIIEGVQAGTIPYAEGLELYRGVRDLASDMRAEIAALKAEGASGWEIVGGVLASIATSLTGVRLWRGASHSYLDGPKAVPAG